MSFDRFTSIRYTSANGAAFTVNPWGGLPRLPPAPQLHVGFTVKKSLQSSSNSAVIKVRNLSPDHRGRIVSEKITLDAFDLPSAFVDRRLGLRGFGAP